MEAAEAQSCAGTDTYDVRQKTDVTGQVSENTQSSYGLDSLRIRVWDLALKEKEEDRKESEKS